ncbi:hypothetical protein TrST_g13369 [Triparma strigata]|uniref:C2 domain-containing protein n=1 Tax=Triparma strigata TaxID=1606541 RepID=A0A9W7F1R0_9STRA|nr:hypothetical protein TrST_g13369 [Triparma strigata]
MSMSGTAYGNLNVHVNRCQSLPDVGSGLFNRSDVYVRVTHQCLGPSTQVHTASQGNSSSPIFDEKLTLSGHLGESILVEVMTKLRFGSDKTVAATLVDLKQAFKAGRKGTLFAWFGLESPEDPNKNSGEVSLSFTFHAQTPPSDTDPVKFVKPWYLQTQGLYQGVKETWSFLGEHQKTSSLAAKVDKLIAKIAKEKLEKEKGEVDEWIRVKLASFDKGVDDVVPKVAEKIPFTEIKLELSGSPLPERVLKLDAKAGASEASSPEDDVPDQEMMSPGGSKIRSLSSRITGYPSLLGASARRTPLKFQERG